MKAAFALIGLAACSTPAPTKPAVPPPAVASQAWFARCHVSAERPENRQMFCDDYAIEMIEVENDGLEHSMPPLLAPLYGALRWRGQLALNKKIVPLYEMERTRVNGTTRSHSFAILNGTSSEKTRWMVCSRENKRTTVKICRGIFSALLGPNPRTNIHQCPRFCEKLTRQHALLRGSRQVAIIK